MIKYTTTMSERIKNRSVYKSPTENRGRGFAMLFTVLIISLILTIALSISDVTFKQSILSGLVKDSQIAFYQADAGIECALYYDVSKELFSNTMAVSAAPQTLTCGNHVLQINTAKSATGYFEYTDSAKGTNAPCFSIVVDKQNLAQTTVQSHGNNICTQTRRQVERSLEATYK